MNLSAFKAYDIRGQYPNQVNEELAYLVGQSVAEKFCAKKIVVGMDMRKSSPSLAAKLIEGINSRGADVVKIGICTTPMLNFAIANYGFDGGVMVSASHNPGKDNAFKIIDRNVLQLSDFDGLDEIKRMVQDGFDKPDVSIGSVSEMDVLQDYANHVMQCIGELKPLNVVVDYGNGVGSISGSPVFRMCGLNPTELFTEPNGDFPHHEANPHDLENFNDLINLVQEKKADIGVFFDGDADRSLVVDDLGRVVPVDLLTVLLARQEIENGKSGNVYYDLRFSKAVQTFIEKAGASPVMMRVGNPFYKKVLKTDGGIMGAEFSGHIMFPDNFCMDDGLFAALKTIKLLSDSGRKLSELIDEVTVFNASPEESMIANNPDTVFDRVIAAFPEGKQIELDGVYLDFPDGFISVRRSNSEFQMIRIRVEADSEDLLNQRFERVKEIITNG